MSYFDPWRTAAVAADVLALAHAVPAALQARRESRLQALLAAARERTALHRERLARFPDDAPLQALPVLTRAELMARFDDSVADPALTRLRVQAHLADPRLIGAPLLDRYIVWESSGTSGQPGWFVQDAAALAVHDVLEALCRPRVGGSARFDLFGSATWGTALERYAFAGAIDGPFASLASLQRLRRLNPWLAPRLHAVSILQPLPAFAAELEHIAPTVLGTHPTAAAMLAEEAARGALALPLRQLLTGGETLGAATRARLQRVLGCPVHDSYGASECLTIAAACAEGVRHLQADWVILEPVDRHGRAVPPGWLSHTTLLTNLANHLQPAPESDVFRRRCQRQTDRRRRNGLPWAQANVGLQPGPAAGQRAGCVHLTLEPADTGRVELQQRLPGSAAAQPRYSSGWCWPDTYTKRLLPPTRRYTM